AARPGEEHGRDYFFESAQSFEARKKNGEFLESAEVHGHGYGTPRRFVEEAIEQGKIVLLNIDVQGGLAIKAGHPDGVYIFVYPPSFAGPEARPQAPRSD